MFLQQKILKVVIFLFLFADNCFSSDYTAADDNHPIEGKEMSGSTFITLPGMNDLDTLKTIEWGSYKSYVSRI